MLWLKFVKGGTQEKWVPRWGHIIVSRKKIVTEKEKLRVKCHCLKRGTGWFLERPMGFLPLDLYC